MCVIMSAFLHCITINGDRWRTRSVRSSINCVHTMHFYAPKTWICQRVIPERNFISYSLACMGTMFCLHPCTRARRFCVRRSCTNGPGSLKVKGLRRRRRCTVTAPPCPCAERILSQACPHIILHNLRWQSVETWTITVQIFVPVREISWDVLDMAYDFILRPMI